MDINNNSNSPVSNLPVNPAPFSTLPLSQLSHTYSDLENLSKCIGNYINNSAFSDVIFLVGSRSHKVTLIHLDHLNHFSFSVTVSFLLHALLYSMHCFSSTNGIPRTILLESTMKTTTHNPRLVPELNSQSH
jgi:hypothetical protein